MPTYKPYETDASGSNRKLRKGSRRTIFVANKVAGRLARKACKDARDERAAAAAEKAGTIE